MKFIADAMLGRLARWLRLMGHDTLYSPGISDLEVLRLAKEQGRIILTRDRHFMERNIRGCLFVCSDDVFMQIAEVAGAFDLKKGGLPGRCAACNGLLEEAARGDVEGLVPEHVYRETVYFQKCSLCGKIYWRGSHFRNFSRILDEIVRGRKADD